MRAPELALPGSPSGRLQWVSSRPPVRFPLHNLDLSLGWINKRGGPHCWQRWIPAPGGRNIPLETLSLLLVQRFLPTGAFQVLCRRLLETHQSPLKGCSQSCLVTSGITKSLLSITAPLAFIYNIFLRALRLLPYSTLFFCWTYAKTCQRR